MSRSAEKRASRLVPAASAIAPPVWTARSRIETPGRTRDPDPPAPAPPPAPPSRAEPEDPTDPMIQLPKIELVSAPTAPAPPAPRVYRPRPTIQGALLKIAAAWGLLVLGLSGVALFPQTDWGPAIFFLSLVYWIGRGADALFRPRAGAARSGATGGKR